MTDTPVPPAENVPPLPSALTDFVKAVTPAAADSPVRDAITPREAEIVQTPADPSYLFIPGQQTGADRMVELQIRHWMMRQQREKQEQQAQARKLEAAKKGPAPK